MADLEHRLRDAAMGESAAYEPSAHLPDRIGGRVRARRRGRAVAGGAMVVAAGMVAALALQLPGDDEHGVVAHDPTSTTITSTTTVSTTTTFDTTTTTLPPPRALDASTPLDARGVGPIEAGMTVAEAEAASGLELLITDDLSAPGDWCYFVTVQGQPDLQMHVSGAAPNQRDAVIRSVSISAYGPNGGSQRRTASGVGVGSTEAEVRQAHRGAVEERPNALEGGPDLYVHPPESPGYGIHYVFDLDRLVSHIEVGEAGSLVAPDECI